MKYITYCFMILLIVFAFLINILLGFIVFMIAFIIFIFLNKKQVAIKNDVPENGMEIEPQNNEKLVTTDFFKAENSNPTSSNFNTTNTSSKSYATDIDSNDTPISLSGKYVVFTGKLCDFTRNDAIDEVSKLGGIPQNGVTKKTNVLVIGEDDFGVGENSNKKMKADQYISNGQDLQIIYESEFKEIISYYS